MSETLNGPKLNFNFNPSPENQVRSLYQCGGMIFKSAFKVSDYLIYWSKTTDLNTHPNPTPYRHFLRIIIIDIIHYILHNVVMKAH